MQDSLCNQVGACPDLGEALLEVGNLVAHVAHFLKGLRGCVLCSSDPDLRRVALLSCLNACTSLLRNISKKATSRQHVTDDFPVNTLHTSWLNGIIAECI